MKDFKKSKYDTMLSAFMYLILGLILVFFPETTAKSICYLVAIVIIAIGIVKLISYFTKKVDDNLYRNDISVGLILMLVGFVIVYKVKLVISIIPFILGILVVISGFGKLQTSLDIRKMGHKKWYTILALAAVNIILGIVLLLDPFDAAKTMFIVIGLCMVFSGITDFVNLIYMSKKYKEYLQDRDALNQDDYK